MTFSKLAQAYYDRVSNKNVVVTELLDSDYLAVCRKCKNSKSFGTILETAIDEDVERFCIEHRHEVCRWTWKLVEKVYL